MKRIVIFGGSFDPIHSGHMAAARLCAKRLRPDAVYFVPTYSGDLKNRAATPARHRIAMVRAAIRGSKKMRLCLWDVRNRNLRSVNLVRHFAKKFPKARIYLLIGGDQVNGFSKWHEADAIADMAQIVYVSRPGHDADGANVERYRMRFLGATRTNAASTRLREKSDRRHMSAATVRYINANLLYARERIANHLSAARWEHCQRTARYAMRLARLNGLKDWRAAYAAGLFHDLAKEFPRPKLLRYAKKMGIGTFTSVETLHPYVGAYIMERDYLFDDARILDAVYYHTEPAKKRLSKLIKVLFVADKCEPGREVKKYGKYYDIVSIRAIAKTNIDKAFARLLGQINAYFASVRKKKR